MDGVATEKLTIVMFMYMVEGERGWEFPACFQHVNIYKRIAAGCEGLTGVPAKQPDPPDCSFLTHTLLQINQESYRKLCLW